MVADEEERIPRGGRKSPRSASRCRRDRSRAPTYRPGDGPREENSTRRGQEVERGLGAAHTGCRRDRRRITTATRHLKDGTPAHGDEEDPPVISRRAAERIGARSGSTVPLSRSIRSSLPSAKNPIARLSGDETASAPIGAHQRPGGSGRLEGERPTASWHAVGCRGEHDRRASGEIRDRLDRASAVTECRTDLTGSQVTPPVAGACPLCSCHDDRDEERGGRREALESQGAGRRPAPLASSVAPRRYPIARRGCRQDDGRDSSTATTKEAADAVRRRRRQALPVGLTFDDGGDRVRQRVVGKAACPVRIWTGTQPKAQMSVRWSTAWPRACSGLMYAPVPRSMPSRVRPA